MFLTQELAERHCRVCGLGSSLSGPERRLLPIIELFQIKKAV